MKTVRWGLVLALLALPWMGTVQTTGSVDTSGVAMAQDKAPAPAQGGPDVNVTVDRGGGTEKTVVWFSNPVLIAIGGVAVLLVVMIIVMAGRGGGTTVIKD